MKKKNILIYLAGIVSGAVLMIFISYLFANSNSSHYGIVLFEEEGDCVSSNSFEVFQVLDNGDVLADELETKSYGQTRTGLTVMFLSNDNASFYDDQIINVPYGKCAKQIGVFKYQTNLGIDKTVPIVAIR